MENNERGLAPACTRRGREIRRLETELKTLSVLKQRRGDKAREQETHLARCFLIKSKLMPTCHRPGALLISRRGDASIWISVSSKRVKALLLSPCTGSIKLFETGFVLFEIEFVQI